MKRTKSPGRSGFTLVEMVITMTAGMTLLLMGIKVVHQTFTLSQVNTDRGQYQQTLGLLSAQLRQDAHAARSATLMQPPSVDTPVLKLEMTDQSEIVYRLFPGRIERRKTLTGADKASTYETYRLSSDHQFEVVVNQSTLDMRVWRTMDNQKLLESHVGAVLNRAEIVQRSARP